MARRSLGIGAALCALAIGLGGAPALAQTAANDPRIFDASPVAPKGAPNIILILLDDVGFGAASSFGGPVSTPVFDRLSADGLRFNRFHTTSVCSPTRAALLTGRNQHRVNFGIASGNEQPQPGYTGIWPRSTASVARVLRDNGYSTAAIGKWHNTPNWEASPVGPFDRWPTGLGFEYFYGFLAGEADQWQPILYRNTVSVTPPAKPGYHFTSDITDDAIGWLHTHASLAPGKPYFLYFAPGATHAPHQVPREWIDKYRDHFDEGWDRLREATLARQKRLGIVPKDTLLTPRPAELPAWASLSADQKRLYARQMEVYAGFLAQTDAEIGRMIDEARKAPGGDNLLVIYIMGDNGASAEGGMNGSDHNLTDIFYGFGADDVASQLSRADQLGSDKLDNHFAIPWAWASDAPFQWMKQISSHLGGTRNPMVIDWPGHMAQHGAVRSDWTHVIDIAPTLYQLIGIAPPASVDGVAQKSIDGISFAYALTGQGTTPQHRTQYFEMFGNRALYQDGWMASARHSLPWELVNRSTAFDADTWELYDLDKDFSQATDLAAKYPERLRAMQQAFTAEAGRNDALPLIANIGLGNRKPSLAAGRHDFVYHADTAPVPSLTGAPMLMGPHRIEADIVVPERGGDGVIVSNGAREGGFTLYVKDGHLVYENNVGGKHHDVIRAPDALPAGRVTIAFELVAAGAGKTGRLFVNGAEVASGAVPRLGPPSYLGAFCVARACGSPVSDAYRTPFAYGGTVSAVRVTQ